MSKLFVDEIVHQSSQGSGTITLGASGETIALASGAEVSGFTGQNYPAFRATMSANQTITTSTETKVDLDTTDYDTDNAFDTTNNRFTIPSGKAGKYLINIRGQMSLSDQDNLQLRIYKNGTLISLSNFYSSLNNTALYNQHADIIDCAVGDYLEFFVYHNYGSDRDLTAGATDKRTLMSGYRIGS